MKLIEIKFKNNDKKLFPLSSILCIQEEMKSCRVIFTDPELPSVFSPIKYDTLISAIKNGDPIIQLWEM